MLTSFAAAFSGCEWLAIILISLIPGLEGRVAIPLALSNILTTPLSPICALVCAFVGSIIPVVPVIFITRKLKNRFLTGFIHERFSSKLSQLSQQTSTLKKLVILAGFVAIPLPLTGAWSGSIIAGLSDLGIWQSFVAIAAGSFVACSIILLVSLFFAGAELVLIGIGLSLVAIAAIFEIIKMIIKKKRTT